jgi:hypothetical protein
MRLPNAERAVVDLRKLRDYCLSAAHPRGRNKARVFESALGFTSAHADNLRDLLLTAARTEEAFATVGDTYGQRYVVEFPVRGDRGVVIIRSAWIVLAGEDFPRLTSCFVL